MRRGRIERWRSLSGQLSCSDARARLFARTKSLFSRKKFPARDFPIPCSLLPRFPPCGPVMTLRRRLAASAAPARGVGPLPERRRIFQRRRLADGRMPWYKQRTRPDRLRTGRRIYNIGKKSIIRRAGANFCCSRWPSRWKGSKRQWAALAGRWHGFGLGAAFSWPRRRILFGLRPAWRARRRRIAVRVGLNCSRPAESTEHGGG